MKFILVILLFHIRKSLALSCNFGIQQSTPRTDDFITLQQTSPMTNLPNDFCVGFASCFNTDFSIASPCTQTSTDVQYGFRSLSISDLSQLLARKNAPGISAKNACEVYISDSNSISDDFSEATVVMCCYDNGCNSVEALKAMVRFIFEVLLKIANLPGSPPSSTLQYSATDQYSSTTQYITSQYTSTELSYSTSINFTSSYSYSTFLSNRTESTYTLACLVASSTFQPTTTVVESTLVPVISSSCLQTTYETISIVSSQVNTILDKPTTEEKPTKTTPCTLTELLDLISTMQEEIIISSTCQDSIIVPTETCDQTSTALLGSIITSTQDSKPSEIISTIIEKNSIATSTIQISSTSLLSNTIDEECEDATNTISNTVKFPLNYKNLYGDRPVYGYRQDYFSSSFESINYIIPIIVFFLLLIK